MLLKFTANKKSKDWSAYFISFKKGSIYIVYCNSMCLWAFKFIYYIGRTELTELAMKDDKVNDF